MPDEPPSDSVGPCNGAPDCPAVLHIHGCFRDDPCPHDRSPERAIEPPFDSLPNRWCTDCDQQGVAYPWKVCGSCGAEQFEPFREGWDESD